MREPCRVGNPRIFQFCRHYWTGTRVSLSGWRRLVSPPADVLLAWNSGGDLARPTGCDWRIRCNSGYTTDHPPPRQVELYATANEAFDQARYEDALQHLQAAIAIGELNVLYLSAGLTFHRLGRCDEAQDAYKHALSSPEASQPPPDAVRARVHQYQAELRDMCPGAIHIRCEDPSTVVEVVGRGPTSCGTTVTDLAAGETAVLAGTGPRRTRHMARVVGLGTTTVRVPAPSQRAGRPVDPRRPRVSRAKHLTRAGQATLGVGAGALVAGLVLDVVALRRALSDFDAAKGAGEPAARSLQQRARRLQVGTGTTYGIGAALAVTGASLWVAGAVRARRRGHRGAGWQWLPWVASRRGGLLLTHRW